MFKSAVRRGRSEGEELSPFGPATVPERLSGSSTKLVTVFNILLESWWMVQISLCVAELASEPNP